MNWKPIIAVGVIGGIGAAGYFGYRYFLSQKELIKEYKVDLLRIKFSSFSEDLLSGIVTLRINNKSAIEATLVKAYADVKLNNKYVGNLETDKPYAIPAKGSNDIDINFSFAGKEVLKDIVNSMIKLILTRDASYNIKGDVKLKSGGLVGASIPFDYTGSVKSDMLPGGATLPVIKV